MSPFPRRPSPTGQNGGVITGVPLDRYSRAVPQSMMRLDSPRDDMSDVTSGTAMSAALPEPLYPAPREPVPSAGRPSLGG